MQQTDTGPGLLRSFESALGFHVDSFLRRAVASAAKGRFDQQKGDIDQLWEIHQEVAGQGAGRKHGVEVINRAAIVFITACWESYVEDVCIEAFDFLLANASDSTVFPARVRALASKVLRESQDHTQIWRLAGDGWKQILNDHRDAVKAKWVDTLNTPKTAQVNGLFNELLGLSNLSGSWSWQGINAQQASEKLDYYITVRGNIAHRLNHDEAVYKNWSTDYLSHVERLVSKTDEKVPGHISALIGTPPWSP
jgi:hypothetical protein